MNLWAVFLTGLTTGGLSCLAVQGGLLAGYLAGRRNDPTTRFGLREAVFPTAAFLAAKFVSYTLLGALLGFLGSLIQLSLTVQIALQILVGLFMVASALRLLNVHPFFSKFELRTPSVFRRLIRKSAKGESVLTPVLLGIFTVLIPCGTTQAMEVLAIGSGSAIRGALVLAVFVLGTAPLFLIIGVLANTGARAFQGTLAKVTAVLVLALGLWTVNGGLALAGSPLAMQNIAARFSNEQANASKDGRISFTPKTSGAFGAVDGAVQEVTMEVRSDGYYPSTTQLKKGVPVRLTLKTDETQGCARVFVIPSLKFRKILPESGTEVIEFTPMKAGPLNFTCTMGMYTGRFYVN